MVSERLLVETIGGSEYPYIFGDAFMYFVIDEKCLFRYARRRGCEQKVRNLVEDAKNICYEPLYATKPN